MTTEEAKNLKVGQIIFIRDKSVHLILGITNIVVKSRCLYSKHYPKAIMKLYDIDFNRLEYYKVEDDPQIKALYL
jgi:hypothetical protein